MDGPVNMMKYSTLNIQVYKSTSYKLKPFRQIVIGYTGQKKNPAQREDWKFQL